DSSFDSHDWKYEMRREIQEIQPGLFLGPYICARDKSLLEQKGITHMLCLLAPEEKRLMQVVYPTQFAYHFIEVSDSPMQNYIRYFPESNAFISSALAAGGRVLVYCNTGLIRSPSFVVAYLMETKKWTFDVAYTHVQNRRFCMNPPEVVKNQLKEYGPIMLARENIANMNYTADQILTQGQRKRGMPTNDDDDDMPPRFARSLRGTMVNSEKTFHDLDQVETARNSLGGPAAVGEKAANAGEPSVADRDGDAHGGNSFSAMTLETGGRLSHGEGVHRELRSRHLQMIAIGTGLFVGSGHVLAAAGPLGILIAFSLTGLMVWGVVTSLGEMSTAYPISGAFSQLSTRFVDPALGFTLGWNYWAQWAVTLPAELIAGGVVMQYWLPYVPTYVWSIVFLVPLTMVNAIGVRGFGEIEYTMSLIKVIAIVIFLLFGVIVFCGGSRTFGTVWFKNWVRNDGNPNAPIGFDPSVTSGNWSLAQFIAILNAFPTAFYSYGGTELVGVTAGEAANPRQSVPKAIKGTLLRICLFYIGALFFVGCIIPASYPGLGGNIQSSPFTLVYKAVGIQGADHIMNAVILVAVLSAANSSIYACSRTLMGLAREGKAPRFLGKVDKRGVPTWSLAISIGFGALALVGNFVGDGKAFVVLSNIIGVAILLSWLTISITHLRFRAAMKAQNMPLADLPYVAPWHPFGDIIALLLGGVVIAGLLYSEVSAPFDAVNDSVLYVGFPLFFVLYFGFKAYYFIADFVNKRFHKGWIITDDMWKTVPLNKVDFVTDRLQLRDDEDDVMGGGPPPPGIKGRLLFYTTKAWDHVVG
ncbi:hypothetical protein HK101_011584, partial [Irineochytrium annulatum]